MFEPYYDSYRASVAMAGAVEKLVTLRSPSFAFDEQQLRAAFGPKTRAILVNTPHNPSGKVYSRAEMELIASLCIEHDVLAITDEVYEHLVFDGEHVPLASLPGMRERTVVILVGRQDLLVHRLEDRAHLRAGSDHQSSALGSSVHHVL